MNVKKQEAKNYLSDKEKFQLTNWCLNNQEVCSYKTYPQLASEATLSLGFNVTDSNITSAIITAEIPRLQRAVVPQKNDRPGIVAQILISYFEAVGYPVPDALRRIAQRKNPKD